MCPYYYELDPVMKYHPSLFVAYTNEMSHDEELDSDSGSDKGEEEILFEQRNEENVLVEHNVNVLDALEKIDSTNTEVSSNSSSTLLTKHHTIVIPIPQSTKFSNSSDEQEDNNENSTKACVVDVCRITPLRKKQQLNRTKKRSKKTACTITDAKNKNSVEIMPESVAKYYEERSSSLKSKDKQAAEKHSIEMKTEKFKLMMDLIKHGVADDLKDAKLKINSNLFE